MALAARGGEARGGELPSTADSTDCPLARAYDDMAEDARGGELPLTC